jgi:hypothetical protein
VSRDQDEDLFRRRAQMLAALEAPAPVSKRRRSSADDGEYLMPSERMDGGDPQIDDEIATAIDVRRAMPNADDLSLKAGIRARTHADLGAQAPFMRVNPVSVLKGTLGGQQQMTTGERPKQVVFWGGDDAETQDLIITLGAVGIFDPYSLTLTTIDTLRPYAIVKFGTRGFLQSAEVDIVQGAQFGISGSQCTVEVALEDTVGVGPFRATVPLSGMLSFGCLSKTPRVTRTKYVSALGVNLAASTYILLPPFSRDVWVSPPAEPTTVAFVDSSGGSSSSFTVAANTIQTNWVPIPGDCVAVRVFGAGASAPAKIIFGLCF